MVVNELPSYLEGMDLSVFADVLSGVRQRIHVSKAGEDFRVFEMGDESSATTIVLMSPYGVTFLLLLNLAALLSRKSRVIFWESRGCPDVTTRSEDASFTLDAQADLLAEVVGGAGVTYFHFVGWCQAAQLVVKAMLQHALAPQSISFIAPAGLGCALVESDFDRFALPIYEQIAEGNVETTTNLSKILDKYRDDPERSLIDGDRLTMLHLSSPEATQTFSKYIRLYRRGAAQLAGSLEAALGDARVLSIHCKDDVLSHYSESVQLARRIPGAKVALYEKGGHLQLFNDPTAVAGPILRFIDGASAMDEEAGSASRTMMQG